MTCCFHMKPTWKRPKTTPVGKVWYRFKGVDKEDSPGRSYQIRDLKSNSQKDVLLLISNHMFEGDRLYEVLNLNRDTVTPGSMIEYYQFFTQQKLTLACYLEDEEGEAKELVGVNFLLVKSASDMSELDPDFDEHVPGEEWKKLLRIRMMTEGLVNVYKKYKVTKYLTGGAMTVHGDHVGNNIEEKFLHTRDLICKEFGLQVIASVFLTTRFQNLAEQNGYEVLGRLPYRNVAQYGIVIPECGTSESQFMGKKLEVDEQPGPSRSVKEPESRTDSEKVFDPETTCPVGNDGFPRHL